MNRFLGLPRDTLKLLFSNIDISLTVSLVEAKYANAGRGRSRFPVRSMLLAFMFMGFEAIPSVRKLCRRLSARDGGRRKNINWRRLIPLTKVMRALGESL